MQKRKATPKAPARNNSPRNQNGHPSVPIVAVRSDIIRKDAITSISMSILCSIGRLEEGDQKPVLAPAVELSLDIETEPDQKTVFTKCISMENVAFLLSDMAFEFADICENVADIATGKIKPEINRLMAIKYYLTELTTHLERCQQGLDRALEASRQ